MCNRGLAAFDLLPRGRRRVGREFVADARARRAVPRDTVWGFARDDRGRALDNVFIERLWRTVKYENIYLRGFHTALELERGLAAYFEFYRYKRLHLALDYQTPWEVYSAGRRLRRRNEPTFGAKKIRTASGL